jgi:hypothetical protein
MRQNAFITAFLVSTFFDAAAHTAELRTVALTGQPALGASAGVTYGSFGVHNHPDQYVYGAPVINDAGQVAFRANLTGDGVDGTNEQGVWSEGSGSLALVARTGGQAPGAPSGVNFSTDPALELFFPALNNAGQTAFYAALTDGGLGLWSEGSGSLAPAARSGQPAPGTPSGVTFNFNLLYEQLDSPVLNDAGQTVFRTLVAGSGISNLNALGIWSEGSGSLLQVARRGSPVPGLPGVSHDGFYQAGLNNAGQTIFYALLSGSGVNSENNQAVWSEGSGSLAMVARQGGPVPGMAGVTFGNINITGAINDVGQTAFTAGLSSEDSPLGQDSVWLADLDGLTLLARRGEHPPGTPSGVTYDAFFGWPALNVAGQTLFGAILMGNGVDASNDRALFLSDEMGIETLVLRLGDQAPGTPAGTFLAVNPDNVGTLVVNSAGQVASMNGLTGDGVDSTNDRGIWATDRMGAQQLIARKGDALEVAPGDSRTIAELTFVGDTGNSNGWPSSFNNVGQVAFWASFTDGSQGVFVSNKVATVPGDFNFDGTVDTADYIVWRKGPGTLYSPSHYNIWRANFGTSLGSGSGTTLPSAAPLSAAIPEPTALALAALAIAPLVVRRKQPDRRARSAPTRGGRKHN